MFKSQQLISIIALSCMVGICFARSANFDAGIQQAKETAAIAQEQAQQLMKNFNPHEVFDKYNANPEQSKFYTNVKESNAEGLQTEAAKALGSSDTANTLLKSMQERPIYKINPQNTDIQRSFLIQSEADNIVRGVTSQYLDCQPKQTCQTNYITKMCTHPAAEREFKCRKNLVVNVIESKIEESWSGSCDYLEALQTQGICQIEEEKCLGSAEKKTINDTPITRSCWAKQLSFNCSSTVANDSCDLLDNSNCEQIHSTCKDKAGDSCLTYQQTYRCPESKCVNTANIMCGDGNDYCLNGDCTDHHYQPSKDFSSVLTGLSATNEASKNFDTQSIFQGKATHCRDDAGNFSNCCQEGGWGQDMNLAHCSQSEKILGTSREKKVTAYVGRYCAKKILGRCLEHKETYCVFGSKLARVIQELGRKGQLGVDFGDAKHANCNGITPQQLQRIDLSRIDFGKEILDELNQKVANPNVGDTEKLIYQHIQQFQKRDQAND